MNYGIFLAGGCGSRIKSDIPKQFVKAGNKMMATYALDPLLQYAGIEAVYIVISDGWKEEFLSDIKAAGVDAGKIKGFADPGENRQLSILNGMTEIIKDVHNSVSDKDTVIIHDAARPFLNTNLIERAYKALMGHDGVMPALPMKDTVYLSAKGDSVSELLDRDKIFAGQAPELFLLKKYYDANKALLPEKIHKIKGASEPAVIHGMDIKIIPGDEVNVKVTTDSDLKRFVDIKEQGL